VYVKDETLGGIKFSKEDKQQQAVIQETANGKSLNDGLNSLVQAAGIANIIEDAPVIRPSAAALQYNRAVAEATDAREQIKESVPDQNISVSSSPALKYF